MNLDFIPPWANVIAQVEGYNSPGSRPARDHNPGDLKYVGQAGAVGRDAGGFAVFPDDVTGWQALYRQLTKFVTDFPNFSILDIMAHYLGQVSPMVNEQGDAFSYASKVATALGVETSTTLGELAAGAPGAGIPATIPPPEMIPSYYTSQVPGQVSDLSPTAIAGIVGAIAFIVYLAWS